MRRQVGRAIGREFVSPVVEGMDIDAIIQQIDIQDLLENKLDVNEVLDKVDLNKLLDRIDINKLLSKIDMDKLMDNVDINAIIARSDLESIIQRSSSGFFGSFLNLIRARLAMVDQKLQRIGRCSCCSKEPWLPPRPSKPGVDDEHLTKMIPWPKHFKEFGIAVQFRYCGLLSRTIAWMIDAIIVAFTFTVFVWFLDKLISLFNESGWVEIEGKLYNQTLEALQLENSTYFVPEKDGAWDTTIAFGLYQFCYNTFLIGCFGRTVGMVTLGLLVANRDGSRVGLCRTMIRNALTILNFIFFGWVVALIRRDGKTWTDMISCTCLVYAWNANAINDMIIDENKRRGNNDFATSIYLDDDLEGENVGLLDESNLLLLDNNNNDTDPLIDAISSDSNKNSNNNNNNPGVGGGDDDDGTVKKYFDALEAAQL